MILIQIHFELRGNNMSSVDPTYVYTDKILKVSRYLVEHEKHEDCKRLKFEAYDNDKKIYIPSIVKEVNEFYFTIRKNIVYNVYEDCVNIPIPIFNADDVQIGDRFTIINHPFNKGAIIIRAFDLEDKDIYSASLNSVGMGNKEYSKYVFDIIRPEQLPIPLVFLNHRRPDVVIYERMEA